MAILLVNLGTPENPSVPAVRSYLREFLMDPYVIDIPVLIRWLLVNLIIAPFRAPKSAAAYQEIWTKEGSPLRIHSQELCKEIEQLFPAETVHLCMRYGNPSISDALKKLQDEKEILVLPLYPQYANATNKSVIDTIKTLQPKLAPKTQLRFIESFYNFPPYIEALARSIRQSQELGDMHPEDHLVFSYHGLPIRQLPCTQKNQYKCPNGEHQCPKIQSEFPNCYRAHCYETSRSVAAVLGLKQEQWSVCFQSRLGKIPWIQPYTTDHVDYLIKRGQHKIAIICPAFISDCLETLEEINIGIREQFISNGGSKFTYIPCLNAQSDWAVQLLKEHLQ